MKILIGFGISSVSFLFGAWHITLAILAALAVLDIFTGIVKGFMLKEVRSRKLSNGLFRKAGFVALIILANMIDLWIGVPFFRNLVVGLLIANEAISILENLTQMGVPIPKKLIQFLQIVKEDDGDINNAKAEIANIRNSAKAVENNLNKVHTEMVMNETEDRKN